MESLPLASNGKIDKKSLPKLEEQEFRREHYLAPRNAIEAKLCGIWQVVLKIEEIGVNDDFFDLGGHSIALLQTRNQINSEFNINLSIKQLFDNPVLTDLYNLVCSKMSAVGADL